MKYERLVEYNENEGETWEFYVQQEDNEEALHLIQTKLGEFYDEDDEERYHWFDDVVVEESIVDILLEYGNDNSSGYMDKFNKVKGKLDVEKIRSMEPGDLENALYKGGIKDLMI